MSKSDSIRTQCDNCTLTCTAVVDLTGARVWRATDITRIERAALNHGLPLMERAGRAAAQLILRLYPAIRCAAIVAGTGNNGGDAWVCARYLRQSGVRIRILAVGEGRTDDARQARHLYEVCQSNHPVQASAEDNTPSDVSRTSAGDSTPSDVSRTGIKDSSPSNASRTSTVDSAPSEASRAGIKDCTPSNASRTSTEDNTPANASRTSAEDSTSSNVSRTSAEDSTSSNVSRTSAEDSMPADVSRPSTEDSIPSDASRTEASAQQPSQGRGQGVGGLTDVDVIIDGLLGTGVSGPPRAEYTQIIDHINASGVPVFSLDLPSGLHPDTGAGHPVRAQHTLSFLALKHALFTAAGSTFAGEVYLCDLGLEQTFDDADLGLEQTFYEAVPHWYELATAVPRLHRRPDSHKGDYGSVWIVGGQGLSEGSSMAGAVLLAARAAARSGCGLVRVFSHSDHAGVLAIDFRDAIYHDALAGWPTGHDHPSTVAVLGPGLGRSQWSEAVFAAAIQLPGQMVIDADGLNILATQTSNQASSGKWVITPHPKEAARLLDTSTEQVQNDRFEAARALAKRYNCVAVLKGHATVISDGDNLALCPFGNPGMSCAGMGDVLSGIIAALLAQGLEPLDACTQAVALHARTADRLATLDKGQSLTASDVAESIRL